MSTQMEQDLQHLRAQSRGAGLGPEGASRHSPTTPLAPHGPGPELRPRPGREDQPAGPTHRLTLSFTRPEPLCRRFRRYSSKHWLLPRDSWEISGRRSVREGAS